MFFICNTPHLLKTFAFHHPVFLFACTCEYVGWHFATAYRSPSDMDHNKEQCCTDRLGIYVGENRSTWGLNLGIY